MKSQSKIKTSIRIGQNEKKKTVNFRFSQKCIKPLENTLSTRGIESTTRNIEQKFVNYFSDRKNSISLKKKKSKVNNEDDPLLLYSPLSGDKPPPKLFSKFLNGEVDTLDVILQRSNQSLISQDQTPIRKQLLKRGKTIFLKHKGEQEDQKQSKIKILQKFIQGKIIKRKMKKTTSQEKRSQIIDIIQEQRPISVSSNVKRLKQMQILYIPKDPIEIDNETPSCQRLKFMNDSDEYLLKLEEKKQEQIQNQITSTGKLLIRQLKKVKQQQKKQSDYYTMENEIFTQKDILLYNYLKDQKCINQSGIILKKQNYFENQKNKHNKSQQKYKSRQPLENQIFKNNSEQKDVSCDISLQSVYEYFLDDLYLEQQKLEQKLNLQQSFNVNLEKQMKTINKIQTINSRVIDYSMHKLLDQ